MHSNQNKIKVLFLCTGNSCRSQMAQGFANALLNDQVEACSAGIAPKGLDLRAVKVMSEIGIDISSQTSRHVRELKDIPFDYVITVCGHAQENCPVFPGKVKVLHQGFEDPPKLAEKLQTEHEKLDCYRKVRDQIKALVEKMPGNLI
jgi:arsenate reductase (thioredoxin)